jgi:hypothetical protein
MGTMNPNELLKLWTLEQVSVEMAIGHILQNMVKTSETLGTHDTSLYKLRSNVDDLIVHTGVKPRSKNRKKYPKEDQTFFPG